MSDAPADARLEYAVRRLNWRRTHYGIVHMPGFAPFGALPSFEEADADRARREAEVRARITNPFVCGPNHAARSRLPEPIFCDWLRDVGIEPMQLGQQEPLNWDGWWEQARGNITAEQVAHVWDGLDRVRFFEVVARPEGCIGYAVMAVDWEYNDNWFEPGAEGGTPVKVFRRWADAEACRRENEEAMRHVRAPDPHDDPMRFETTRWTDEAFWPLGPPVNGCPAYENATFTHGGAAPFYEIVEIELPGARPGGGDG
ncbi:MAG: hypothetical protein J0I06_12410 [Planctomycetes bacterium]|nr:hypothetical protein [Planctomycetota bacterium]